MCPNITPHSINMCVHHVSEMNRGGESGEMVQQLRADAALAEDVGLVLSNHSAAQAHLERTGDTCVVKNPQTQ